jgi:thioredoxin 1
MKKIIAITTLLAVFASFSLMAADSAKPVSKETNIIQINSDSEFTNTIKDGVYLVDFYADWCGPCRMLAPTIKKLANKYDGKAKIIKIDVDKNQDLARKYGITGIPDVRVFKNGKEVEKFVGLRSEADYQAGLNKALGNK